MPTNSDQGQESLTPAINVKIRFPNLEGGEDLGPHTGLVNLLSILKKTNKISYEITLPVRQEKFTTIRLHDGFTDQKVMGEDRIYQEVIESVRKTLKK